MAKRRSKGRVKKYYENAKLIDFERAREEREKADRESRREEGDGKREKRTYESETEILEVDPETSVKRPKVNRRRAQRWRRFFVYLLVFVVLGTMIGFSVHDIVTLKIEERELKQEQSRLLKEKDDLEEELKKVNEPDYIEQQARKQLRMILPGEILYILPTEEELKEQREQEGKQKQEEEQE